jgi:hypothetical protein
MKQELIVIATIWSCLSAAPVSAFDQNDVKPVEVLEGMGEAELAGEARTACTYIAMENAIERQRATLPSDSALVLDSQGDPAHHYQLALEYLATIGAVTRGRHNGEIPVWVNDMEEASTNAEEKRCEQIAKQVERESGPQKGDTATKEKK